MHARSVAHRVAGCFHPARTWLLVLGLAGFPPGLSAQVNSGHEELRARADEAYASGDFLGAMSDYERLVSLFPEEACLHGRLAGCALEEPGRLALVRRHLRIALRKGCEEVDLGYHQARLAQLEYDYERARDLYTAYIMAAGKKARFRAEAERAATACAAVVWDPAEAVQVQVFERIPAEPDAAFRYYDPEVPGLRLVSIPPSLRSKADLKAPQGRMALHDGDTVLVYASLGKKGQQGWDLHRVAIRNGEYSEPEPLAGAVNSPFDEMDAYLSREGMLYFSSNRPGGLGGFDIYAAPCGLDGRPVGAPYRLPYPINSVNDDYFFIPEEDGGAWMASNRAAVRGKVHAYRVGVGRGEMETGSIAWSSDEVEQEGLVLRVFSQGEEVGTMALDGGEVDHLAFGAGSSVRIVLEDAEGRILGESFGDGAGAWELKRGSNGWSLEAQTDVLADWAVLSDFQVNPVADVGTEGASIEGEAASTEMATAAGWMDWIASRTDAGDLAETPDAGNSVSPMEEAGSGPESESTIDSVEADEAEDDRDDMPSTVDSSIGEQGTEVMEAGEALVEDPVTVLPEAFSQADVEALQDWEPEADAVVLMLETRPELVVEVWEAKAEEMLVMERDFLDEPDFSKAGELYDLLDGMASWAPEAERVEPILQDGVAMEDIRSMLDEWSAAVQSATKASLAKVAGEAALAFRRDRLAARELWQASDEDVNTIKRQWSEWREEHRNGAVSDGAADWTEAEGNALFDRWEATLESAGDTWSRKDQSGWRGAWLNRERDLLERSRSLWADHLAESEALAESIPSNEVESGASGEGPAANDTDTDESADDGAMEDVADVLPVAQEEAPEEAPDDAATGESLEGEDLLLTLLWPETGALRGSSGVAEAKDVEGDMGNRDDGWMEAKDVDRAFRRLESVLDGRGLAPVKTVEDWSALDRDVARAYLALMESVIQEVDDRFAEEAEDRAEAAADWDARWSDGHPGVGEEEWEALEQGIEQWREQEMRWAEWEQRAENRDGPEAFEALLERRDILMDASSTWAAWNAAWISASEAMDSAAAAEPDAIVEAAPVEEEADKPSEVADVETEGDPGDGIEPSPIDAVVDNVSEEPAPLSEEPDESGADVALKEDEGNSGREGAPSTGSEEEMTEVEPASTASRGAAQDGAVSPVAGPTGARSDEGTDPWSGLMERLGQRVDKEGGTFLTAAEREALEAWRERQEIASAEPAPEAGRSARMAWDKKRFFNDRRWRAAVEALDADAVQQRLDRPSDLTDLASGESVGADADGASAGSSGEAVTAPRPAFEPRNRQDEDAARFGVILPEAEVVVSSEGTGSSGRGLSLRPISREDLERAILTRPLDVGAETAAARFAGERGAPKVEGVEYKVQVGAFRNALPAALFAAFDPMWAQRLDNGVTRYMAGSFDYYDDATVARDAIRALGYEDAFVVRFTDGVRVGSARPEPELLAEERQERPAAGAVPAGSPANGSSAGNGAIPVPVPTRAEDIPTWDGVQGRVFSVQVGAFRGVPDREALASLGTLTREDAGRDGWLRLFSGRFGTQEQARVHREELRAKGRADAFIVVYVNGRRIPLSEASTTAVSPLPGSNGGAAVNPAVPAVPDPAVTSASPGGWSVELGVFTSTIPVRLANVILDAPLEWGISSSRSDGRTTYRTAFVEEGVARTWLGESRRLGFSNARLVRE